MMKMMMNMKRTMKIIMIKIKERIKINYLRKIKKRKMMKEMIVKVVIGQKKVIILMKMKMKLT